MRKIAIFVGGSVCGFAVLAYALWYPLSDVSIVYPRDGGVMYIDNVPITVSVVDTPAERMQGLSGRDGLRPNEGMLFIFPEDEIYSFWMKDMRFPIDIIWLSAEGEVVGATVHVGPETYPETFSSPEPVRLVLEVPAGFVAAHGISLSSKIAF